VIDEARPGDELEPFGRVGYGRLARYSPAILALIIVAAVIFIAVESRKDESADIRDLIGQPAHAIAMTAFDGSSTTELTALRGKVVVLNFWGSWCDPCRREMPAFERIHQEGAPDVAIVGINAKADRIENAMAFLAETGASYQIVRDQGSENPDHGLIEQAFGVGRYYPVTIFIRPDGVIDAVQVGEITESQIRDAIAAAQT
jgi:cytochrome c biogenesis protein CcmG/thiol:disulfide interchange protein DsbE